MSVGSICSKSCNSPVVGKQKPVAAKKPAAAAKKASVDDNIAKLNLYYQSKDILLNMGFNLSKAYYFTLSDFVENRSSCQLIKVYVKNKAVAHDLSRRLGLNPNFFEIDERVDNGALFEARIDVTHSVLNSIAEAYAKKHGLKYNDKNAEALILQTDKKLSKNDPECLAIAREIKKRDFDRGNPLSAWNDRKFMLGINRLNFVNFYDFDPKPENNMIIPLDRKTEEFIYNSAEYRIKNKEGFIKKSLLQ